MSVHVTTSTGVLLETEQCLCMSRHLLVSGKYIPFALHFLCWQILKFKVDMKLVIMFHAAV